MSLKGAHSGHGLHRDQITADVVERFAKKIQRTANCWEWTGARLKAGHGVITINKRNHLVHRIAYALTHGFVPPGVVVRHMCDNASCVRPQHLELGSQGDNLRDRIARQRPSHIDAIRIRYAAGESAEALSKEYRLTRHAIHEIVKNKTWPDPAYTPPNRLRRTKFTRHNLSAAQIAEARASFVPRKKGHGIPALAKKYGVAVSTMWEIIHETTSHPGRALQSLKGLQKETPDIVGGFD